MAKKRTSKPVAKAARKVTFNAYMREPSVAPAVDRTVLDGKPYVYHNWDNLFPQEIREIVDNCGPLEACMTMLAEFIAGNGVQFLDKEGKPIEAAQAKFQEWMKETSEEEFLASTAYDLAHGLGMTWNVRRAAGPIVRLDHMSRFNFRAAKTLNGKIPKMFWSNDWAVATANETDDRFKPKEFPVFDFTGEKKSAEAIIYDRQYHPTEPVYGRLFWQGCRRACEVWIKVDEYNRTQLDTGFTPAVILGTRFDGTTDAELDKHDERIEAAFTGAMGRGMLHFPMGLDEKEPFIQVLERGNHAGELDAMRDSSAEVIYNTFRIPAMLMTEKKAGLTSQSEAISVRLQQFQRTLVASHQKFITRNLTKLMSLEGIDVWETKITQLELFDPAQSEAVMMASTLVDQARKQRGDDPHPDEKIGKMLLAQAAKLAADPGQAERLMDKKLAAAPKPGDKKDFPPV